MTRDAFSYSLEVHQNSAYIRVIAHGCGSTEDINKMYQTIDNSAKLVGINKLLLNVTELTLDYSGSDVVKILKVIKQLFGHWHIARVINPADFKNDLIEAFAQKHALNIKSFLSEDEAQDWLSQQ